MPAITRHKPSPAVWMLCCGMLFFCLWEGWKLWHLHREIRSLSVASRPSAKETLSTLRQKHTETSDYLKFLEENALVWKNIDIISWLRERAERTDTQIIGVEKVNRRHDAYYWYEPVEVTFRGDYHDLGRLINSIERSGYPLKLDFLSITQSKREPEGSLILTMVLCRVERREETNMKEKKR